MAQLKKNTSSYGGSLVRCVTACSSKPCSLSNSFGGRQRHSTSPCILEDTSRFRYTFRNGQPLAIRVARSIWNIRGMWFSFSYQNLLLLWEMEDEDRVGILHVRDVKDIKCRRWKPPANGDLGEDATCSFAYKANRPSFKPKLPEIDTKPTNSNPNFVVVVEVPTDYNNVDDVSRSKGPDSSERRNAELPEELSKNVVRLSCESSAEGRKCDVYLIGTSQDSKARSCSGFCLVNEKKKRERVPN
ncbi:hypothetical protein GQ457_17G023540 [Hibiscus cannabinus]